jgi:integration host factor subunit alpha
VVHSQESQREVGLSAHESAVLVEQVLMEITACLERSEAVKLSSFGLFVVRRKYWPQPPNGW